MKSFAAGIAAAAAAYAFNRLIIGKAGNKGMVILIPIVEETLKSSAAVLLNASLINTHTIFGVIEAGYEILGAKNLKGVIGGLSSFAAHGLLGLTTAGVFMITNSLFLGIGAAALLHSVWNRIVTGIYTRN